MSLKNKQIGKETVDVLIMKKYLKIVGLIAAGILTLVSLEENMILYSMLFLVIGLVGALPLSVYLVLSNRG